MKIFAGIFTLLCAAVNVWFMFTSYPSPLCILFAIISLWFTSRSVWWFEQVGTPPMTEEERKEVQEAIQAAKEMFDNGGNEEEVKRWLSRRLNMIKAKWHPDENNQSSGDNGAA